MKAVGGIFVIKTLLIIIFIGIFPNKTHAQNSNLTLISPDPLLEFVDLKKFGVKENLEFPNSFDNKELISKPTEVSSSSVKYEFAVFESEIESSSKIRTIEGGLIFLDKHRFKSMGLSLIEGEPFVVFTSDFNILISDRIARTYFGDENPIDKVLILGGKYSVMIKGVFKSKNNSLPIEFDFIAGPITNAKINQR